MGLHGRQAWVLVYTRCLGYSIDDFGWYLAFSEDCEFPEISPSTKPWNSTRGMDSKLFSTSEISAKSILSLN